MDRYEYRTRAIPRIILSGKYFNHTAKSYSYKIDGLQPGAYDIVVCDERDYKPEVQTATVGPGPGGSTVFFLQDQPKGNVNLEDDHRVEGRLVGEGVPVYLVHARTKCIVAETLTDRKSHYAFRDLPKEEEYEVSFYEPDP